MFPAIWVCQQHVRFVCHTASMHIQSTNAVYLQMQSQLKFKKKQISVRQCLSPNTKTVLI